MRILRAVEVWLSGQRVGLLERNHEGLTHWRPDASWEKGGQRPRLGLSFLRNPGPRQTGTGLPSWFENLLPDVGSALRSRLAQAHHVRTTDSLSLLSVLGRDLPGAVELRPVHGATEGIWPEEILPAGTEEEPSASRQIPPSRLRFSLAGMQLKLSMTAQGDRFALTSRSDDGWWIVKLPGTEYPEMPEVEAATMAWARAAGHDVPTNFAFDVDRIDGLPIGWTAGNPRAYAIERFDRRPRGIRVHHEDFCQALELLPDHKYGDTGPDRFSLDGALRLVADSAGEAEAQRFAHRVGFVIASGNGDAHLKNWSFEWGAADRPVLSPCYDFLSTITWEQFGWAQRKGPSLGLALGRVRRFRQLDRDALIRHSEQSGQSWAREAVMQGIETARTAWPAIEADAPLAMRMAIRTHWRKVPVLIDAGRLPWTAPAISLPAQNPPTD